MTDTFCTSRFRVNRHLSARLLRMQYLWNLPGSCAVCLACPRKVGIFIQAKLRSSLSKICDPFHWTIRKDGFILDGKNPQQVVTCFQWRCCLCRMRCLYTQLLGSRLSRSQLRINAQIHKDSVLFGSKPKLKHPLTIVLDVSTEFLPKKICLKLAEITWLLFWMWGIPCFHCLAGTLRTGWTSFCSDLAILFWESPNSFVGTRQNSWSLENMHIYTYLIYTILEII